MFNWKLHHILSSKNSENIYLNLFIICGFDSPWKVNQRPGTLYDKYITNAISSNACGI